MKKVKLMLIVLGIACCGLLVAHRFANGSLKGTISPADAGIRVWAISISDTLKTNITDGSFEILNIKPGIYKVILEANAPYKNSSMEGVEVRDGETTDIGQVMLVQ